MSPRYPTRTDVAELADGDAQRAARARDVDVQVGDPYRAQYRASGTFTADNVPVYSYFRDLWLVSTSDARAARSLERAVEQGGFGGRDEQGPDPAPGFPDDTVARARARITAGAKRDLSSSSVGDVLRPSAPGWVAETYGRAARQTGTLADALERQALTAGQVDTSSGVPVLTIPRLTGGGAVAIQASQNAAVQETDPTTSSYTAPVGTIAGLVDASRQLLEFSRPGLDQAISQDLGRASGTVLDSQLIAGSGSSGQLRGLATVSGILTLATSATTAQGQLSAIWAGFNSLAGSTGFGSPAVESYICVLHPRRYAWLSGGSGNTGLPVRPNVPGQVVLTGGVRTNLGASTSEDEVFLVDREAVLLAGGSPEIEVFEEIGSATLTVRIRSVASAALVVKSPVGIVRISGFATPTF